ncbi:MAG: circularly permuted type 2 ATP-grasp protein [Blastomonas sp.]
MSAFADRLLRDYLAQAPEGDIYAGASPWVADRWSLAVARLQALTGGNLDHLHNMVGQQVDDLGVAFRLTGEQEERAWPLNPMPLIIGADEWATIEAGLTQRAELLERVIADIYGPQSLVTSGDLPAPVVSGSRHFARKMVGVPPPAGHHVHFYAVDLARGPDGEWRVLADRLRLAAGIGYALENRLALSRASGDLLTTLNARRLASFFASLRQGIARDCERADPRIALLTPGRFNQSYPEQAHLARYMGVLLVEGRDLAVSDNRLFVRTIEGLKHIDALWRWVDTSHIDPLAFDARSTIGVPDLFEALARGDLVTANWPGAGVVEARAFAAFLPRLARKVLGEDLVMPNVATWWCGQPGEHDMVLAQLDSMVINSAFGTAALGLAGGRSRAVANLDEAERGALLAGMKQRPMDYTGQEIVHLSTTPSLSEGQLVPRPFTLRAFVTRDEHGAWKVMPGAFGRLSAQGDLRTSLMGEGDISVDVCIVDNAPVDQVTLLGPDRQPAIRRMAGILPSQAADNLFWFARYIERAEMTIRVIRALLGNSIEVDGSSAAAPDATARLVALLVSWGAVDAEEAEGDLEEICRIALVGRKNPGGARSLLSTIRNIGQGLRERMAIDFWRIVNNRMPHLGDVDAQSMLDLSTEIIDRLLALAGIASENMGRSAAWRFHDMGRRLERAVNICRITRQFAGDEASNDDLNILLDLCDSQISYRARYLVGPMVDPVRDLVVLEPHNPRAVMYQLHRMAEHLAELPSLRTDGMPEAQLRAVRALNARIEGCEASEIDEDWLRDIETRLLALSDAISQRYFLQFNRAEKPLAAGLLA